MLASSTQRCWIGSVMRSRIMKAEIGGLTHLSISTVPALTTTQAASTPTTRRSARRASPGRAAGPAGSLLNASSRLDRDRLGRHVLVAALVAGLDRGNRIHDFHARIDAPEHGVTVVARLVVEEVVVDQVDEELRGGAVDVVGARHRQRAALVLEAVGGFVLDRLVAFLVLHVRGQAAALDHEARDHAVE